MSERGDVGGVLLAGGLGRRMGGRDKALLMLSGRPLVAHAAERLGSQTAHLIINANGDPARFAALPCSVVADETPDFPGPLGGILAALRWYARERPQTRWLASLPADTPFAPHDFVRRLKAATAASPAAPMAVAQSRGRRHPVIALWPMEASAAIGAALAGGARKAEAMIDRLGAVAVPFADLEIDARAVDPFFNINTPEDLAYAEEIASAHASRPSP